jgi:hypothetical protein
MSDACATLHEVKQLPERLRGVSVLSMDAWHGAIPIIMNVEAVRA